MQHHRQLLALDIGLIGCCLVATGVLTSRQADRFEYEEKLMSRDLVESRQEQSAEARVLQRLSLLSLLLTGIGGLILGGQMRSDARRHRQSGALVRAARHDVAPVDPHVSARARERSLPTRDLEQALRARADALLNEQQAHAEAEHAHELKDRFLSTVSHELRTPLNAIIGWVHVVKTGTLRSSETHHAIDAIERNAHAQLRLITELLDVSKMIQGRLAVPRAPVDFRQAVDAAVNAVRPAVSAKGNTLDYLRSDTEVRVLGDEARLQQVAANLLLNAIKFTPGEGRLEVEVLVDDDFAELRVRDTGEGVDPKSLPHVFDLFFQAPTATMRAGLGLGLALVKELVTLHGGTVTVQSPGIGQGATATVRLPITRASSGVPVVHRRSA